MTDGQSLAYFQRRADQEQNAARDAACELAAERHRQLADEYRRLVLAGGGPVGKSADLGNETSPTELRLIR